MVVKDYTFIRNEVLNGCLYDKTSLLNLEIDVEFVQDNHSLRHALGALRGLHFQVPPAAQGKPVRCGRGVIFDVALDIRRGSLTYGKSEGYELTADNGHQLYVSVPLAHGFVILEADSEVLYKCTDYYAPEPKGRCVGIVLGLIGQCRLVQSYAIRTQLHLPWQILTAPFLR